MKKLLMLLISVTLLLPLYAQDVEPDESINTARTEPGVQTDGVPAGERQNESEEGFGEIFENNQPKKPLTFAREKVEFGYDIGAGLDNDFIGLADIFKKNIVIDLDKAEGQLGNDGLNLNLAVDGGLFVNAMNITIKGGIWDFGFFSGAGGDIYVNVPQSLFTLISRGNINQRSFTGMINVSGGIFANAGLRASAKYGKLRVGVRPALYTPLVFIPKSGITFDLKSEEDISLTTTGEIKVYYPVGENGEFTGLQFGFDMSLEGEYELFSFLDVGGSFSSIPVAPAKVKNGMLLSMTDKNFEIKGDNFLEGNVDIPDFGNLEFIKDYDVPSYNVLRPLRFDAYARYKAFKTYMLTVIVKPNVGFSVDINNKQGYFNAGAEGQLNIRDIFLIHLGTGYEDAIWKHRLGFALNFRAFELDMEAAIRSSSFTGSFKAQGFGLNLGMRFGW